MSEITREEVKHLAKLALIELNETELNTIPQQLATIINAIENIQEITSKNIPPTSHPTPLKNVFRPDTTGQTLNNEETLSQAPDSENGKFKVPAILEEQ